MADFCYQCTESVLGLSPDLNDLSGLVEQVDDEDRLVAVLCEGCGFTCVDNTGHCERSHSHDPENREGAYDWTLPQI